MIVFDLNNFYVFRLGYPTIENEVKSKTCIRLSWYVQHVWTKSSVATTPFNSHFNVLIGFKRGWFSVPPLIFKFRVRKILFKFLGCVQLRGDIASEAGTIYVNLSTPSNGILTRLQSPFQSLFQMNWFVTEQTVETVWNWNSEREPVENRYLVCLSFYPSLFSWSCNLIFCFLFLISFRKRCCH